MRDMKYLYAYKHKQTGNVILTRSVITSKDWELVKDNEKNADTTQTETAKDDTAEAAQEAPEESKGNDTAPAEKSAEAPAAAKKKAATAAKKSTGKKV